MIAYSCSFFVHAYLLEVAAVDEELLVEGDAVGSVYYLWCLDLEIHGCGRHSF